MEKADQMNRRQRRQRGRRDDMPTVTITPEEFYKRYGVSVEVLANRRWKKQPPPFYKIGRKVLYRISDVEAFIFKNPVLTTDK